MRTHSPVSPVRQVLVSAGVAALATGLTTGLAACGSGEDRPARQVEVANTINYGSFGTSTEIDCGDGKSLNVGGSNNTLTVKGACTSVNIGGADNKITLKRVDGDLSVVGINNTVTYSEGDPRVNDTGSGNRISGP